MFKKLNTYFKFNKTERKGFVILLAIFSLFVLVKWIFTLVDSKDENIASQVESIINSRYKGDSSKSGIKVQTLKEYQSSIEENKSIVVPFDPHPFNPNTASEDELLSMGIRPKLVRTILNYRSKGGSFKQNTGLSKVYGITKDELTILAPFLILDSKKESYRSYTETTRNVPSESHRTLITYDINSADSTQLESLNGIGPYFAARIIKYRNGLGGFLNLNQLMEVYGMDSTLFRTICSQVTLSNSKIIQIHINTIPIDQLKNHPYIRWKNANAIINYRNQHGYFKSKSDLKNVILLSDETLTKIYPYISID